MQSKLNGALEENVLTMLCYSEQYAADISLQVSADLFSSRNYRRIAEEAIGYLEKYRKPPRTHIRDLLERELTRGEGAQLLKQVIEAMEVLDRELQPEYVLEQLDSFIQIRRLTQQVEEASDALHRGELGKAREALSSQDLSPKSEPGIWLHDTAQWLNFLDKDDADFISSGIDVLDERGVYPAKKEMYLIIGPSGVGKSWLLSDIGKRAIIAQRKSVLHITLENNLAQMQQRYTQSILSMTREENQTLRIPMFKRDDLDRFSGFEFEQVTPLSLQQGKAEIAKALLPYQGRGKLLLKWFPTGTLTIAGLNAFLDVLERSSDFRPDLLLLDYADLMQLDARDLRISTGRLFRDLRGIAGARDLAVITATQGNRISAGAKVVTSTMVAEDWSKIGTADTVITICQTPEERESGLARIFVPKARNAVDKWIALITQSYATGQFALDSVYFNKYAENEVMRMTGEDSE